MFTVGKIAAFTKRAFSLLSYQLSAMPKREVTTREGAREEREREIERLRLRQGEWERREGERIASSHHLFPFDTQASLVIGGTVFSA